MPELFIDELTPEQSHTLRALADCIIPQDDFPSGWDAGVGQYISGQFKRDLKGWIPRYRDGLTDLNAEARVRFGSSFTDLKPEDQVKLLEDIEKGAVSAKWSVDPRHFFSHVIAHCMEGFYADPGNGGNLNKVAWKMVGFEVTA